ncbi:uncharacterized protein METZ01_LOCUS242309 [marine metagenome]|uniref:Uncharacterized protein n=1 Tax=marine metagenome TaxID=408172 RepID=A0A382HQY9_9ZZZZ
MSTEIEGATSVTYGCTHLTILYDDVMEKSD